MPVDPLGRFVYVASSAIRETEQVFPFRIGPTGSLSPTGSPTATGPLPVAIVVEPAGQFAYVVNSGVFFALQQRNGVRLRRRWVADGTGLSAGGDCATLDCCGGLSRGYFRVCTSLGHEHVGQPGGAMAARRKAGERPGAVSGFATVWPAAIVHIERSEQPARGRERLGHFGRASARIARRALRDRRRQDPHYHGDVHGQLREQGEAEYDGDGAP